MMSLKTEQPIIGQYDYKTTTILQVINGQCYLSQGGPQFIDYIVNGIDLCNKQILSTTNPV